MNYSKYPKMLASVSSILILSACGGSGSSSNESVTSGGVETGTVSGAGDSGGVTTSSAICVDSLSGAYLEFVAAPNVETVLSSDGCTVSLESDGKPDHTSPYWDPDGSSGLWVAHENPEIFGNPDRENHSGRASPGFIDDYINVFNLTVPVYAEKAASPSSTSLGAIGIALSGTPIFNDQEGNGDVGPGVAEGLDRNGAHTGPQTYHYHLEPKAISEDNFNLVGIMADGFFIYGRREFSTGEYPTDLDQSNGHIGMTPQDGTEEVYHYHIDQDEYLTEGSGYYLLFPGDFQGTPNAIN